MSHHKQSLRLRYAISGYTGRAVGTSTSEEVMNQVNQELFLLVVPFPTDQDAAVEQSGLQVLNHEADPLSKRYGDVSRSQVR